MKLKAVLNSLEGLDESLHGFYAKGGDEKFYLEVDGLDDHPSKLPVLRKNTELLTENRALKQKVQAFEGIEDVEALKTAAARVAELEEQIARGGKGAAEIEKLQREHQKALESLRTQTQQQIAEANERAAAKESAAREYFQTGEISRALAANGGDPDMIAHYIVPRTKVIEENGRFVRLAVIDDSGNERVKDSKLTPVSIDDFVGELKEQEKWGGAFKPSGKTGSGADPLAGGGNGGNGRVVKAEGGIVRVDPAKVVSGDVRVAAN